MKQARKSKSRLWSLSWVGLLAAPGWASVYPLPSDGSPVVGSDESVQAVYEDTLPDIAHRYSLGYYEIIRANPGVDVWLPRAGTKLLLPGRRILPAGPPAASRQDAGETAAKMAALPHPTRRLATPPLLRSASDVRCRSSLRE